MHSQAPDLKVTAVDVIRRPGDLPADIAWMRAGGGGADVPPELTGLRNALVVAHEWLDVVPCPVLEHDGSTWRVVEVDESGVERLGADADPADVRWCEAHWPVQTREGDRVEVGRPRDTAYAALRTCIDSGVLVAVDYGHLRKARPAIGTLAGYRRGAACKPLPDGTTDITAHVAMDALAVGSDAELLSQRALFDRLGVRPPTPPLAMARTDPPRYLSSLARRSAYTALSAGGGLGDFWWSIDPIGETCDSASRRA